MNDTEKLLPCPFCVGEAEVWKGELHILDMVKICYCVYCKDCCCTTQHEYIAKEAIAAWNKRI